MTKFNPRGKGKKDVRIEKLEQLLHDQQLEIETLKARLQGAPPEPNAFTANPGKVRRRQVRARSYQMYLAMGGDALDQQLRNAHRKSRAFASQLEAAEAEAPGLAWGPNITVYEDRMTGSLVARLIREKRAMLDLCLREAGLDAKECEELGEELEVDTRPREPETPAPRTTFSDEEKKELLAWLEGGSKGEPPAVAEEFDKAALWMMRDQRRMTPEMFELMMRIEAMSARAQPEETPRSTVGG